MKLLSISDWRVQSTELLYELIQQYNPDIILYAGDDLKRILPVGQKLLIKSSRKAVEIAYPNFTIDKKLKKECSKTLLEKIEKISIHDSIT